MKNIFNNIFGISQRSNGKLEDDGTVTIEEIISYDLVANPGLSNADLDWAASATEHMIRNIERLKRQELLKNRKDKINKLNNL